MRPSVSFVIPCLNEETTLGSALGRIKATLRGPLKGWRSEIVVSDNGSTDASVAIAKRHGARVVHCKQRGYGAALKAGFSAARGDAVIFADADNTYDFREAPVLLEAWRQGGYDLVIGSRYKGRIHPGAMPFTHRWLGTPVLTAIINLLYRSRKTPRLSDCNSGFRCFSRRAFPTWGVEGNGMEFITEMLVKALRHGASYVEVPISLSPDVPGRRPHLRTWRDGMRNVLTIFSSSPAFFHRVGAAALALSWLLMAVAYLRGPVRLGFMEVLGPHSMLFFLLVGCLGLLVWSAGLFLAARDASSAPGLYRRIYALSEGVLFWTCLLTVGASLLMLLGVVLAWSLVGFRNLGLERETILVVSFATQAGILIWSMFTARLLKVAAAWA